MQAPPQSGYSYFELPASAAALLLLHNPKSACLLALSFFPPIAATQTGQGSDNIYIALVFSVGIVVIACSIIVIV